MGEIKRRLSCAQKREIVSGERRRYAKNRRFFPITDVRKHRSLTRILVTGYTGEQLLMRSLTLVAITREVGIVSGSDRKSRNDITRQEPL